MNPKFICLLIPFLCLFGAPLTYGQTSITGQVLSQEGETLENVTVQLLRLSDGVEVGKQATDQQGKYIFSLALEGRFTLQFSALGYRGYTTSFFDISNGEKKTNPTVHLQIDVQELEAVRIEARQPAIRQYVDKLVVDVEGSVLSEGNNVLELLEKTPGIVSDGKGNFSIQGRTGANVKIDGRETYLSGEQLASLLRGMQANDIAKLELMANPSAREDAAGTAGIINIVTKRNKRNGFGGDLFARGSRSRDYQGTAGGGLHYKLGGLNTYISGSVGHERSNDSTIVERQFHHNRVISSTQRQKETKALDPGRFHSLRTGASYEFSDGGVLDGSFHWMRGRFITNALIHMLTNPTISGDVTEANTENRFDELFNNLTFNVNYENKYEGEDHFLKFNFDFAPHSNEYDNIFSTEIRDNGPSAPRLSARTNVQALSNTTYAGRLDYSRPLEHDGKIELGWKGTYFFIDNDVRNDTLRIADWIKDLTTSNQFQYSQHIEALYAVYSGKMTKFEYQAGLRGEYTFLHANQVTLNTASKQQYFHLFPSAFLLYHINSQHTLRTSFSSRIERPSDHDINAFRIYQDAFSYSEGNPQLKPERSYVGEIAHGYQNALFTTLGVSYGRNVINWVSRVGAQPHETLTRPENIGNFRNYSASMMYNNRFFAWWTASHYLNAFYNQYTGEIDGVLLDTKGSSWSANSKHTLQVKNGFRAEASAYYQSGVTTGASRTDKRYGLDLAAEKKLMQERAIVKLAINGLIRNANPRYTTTHGDLVIHHSAYPDNRKVMLSLSYRFGN